MSISEISKVPMYKFHYDYIKNKYGNKSKLLITVLTAWCMKLSVMYIWGIWTLLSQKITQQETTTIAEILKYTRPSCLTFSAKMPRYCLHKHCLQEESTHCRLRVLIYFVLEVSTLFGPKNHTIKISNIHRYF